MRFKFISELVQAIAHEKTCILWWVSERFIKNDDTVKGLHPRRVASVYISLSRLVDTQFNYYALSTLNSMTSWESENFKKVEKYATLPESRN